MGWYVVVGEGLKATENAEDAEKRRERRLRVGLRKAYLGAKAHFPIVSL